MADSSDLGEEPGGSPPEKRYDPTKVQLAIMSWAVPLAGLVFSIIANPANAAGLVGALIFPASVVIGFALAVLSLALSGRYRGLRGHAIAGLATSVALALLIAAMFWALARFRAIQARQPGTGPQVEQRIP